MSEKIAWQGKVISVRPRIRLNRSFDERNHSYLGFSLRIDGTLSGEDKIFCVGIGKAAQNKHQLQIGLYAKGSGHPIADPRVETVDVYKISRLSISNGNENANRNSPPWHGIPPSLENYRERGHRRLCENTYLTKCASCIWGCQMAVIITVDQWNASQQQFRVETFCYGPKSCKFYKAGPTRKVPGRKGMFWEEEDWVDEEATAHRGLDD